MLYNIKLKNNIMDFISKNRLKKINNKSKVIYLSLLKRRQDNSLSYKDKMIFICLSYVLPLIEDLLDENYESLANVSRIENFLLATSLLNLENDHDFCMYNIPLFDKQYYILNYKINKKNKKSNSSYNQIEYNYQEAKKLFEIMFSRDKFHTNGYKFKSVIDSSYPYLLCRDINQIIRVNLGYVFSNMYSRLNEINSLIDYRDIKDRYVYMYINQLLPLLDIIFNEYKYEDTISRSHILKNNVKKEKKLEFEFNKLSKDIIYKLDKINSSSFLKSSLIQFEYLIKSNIKSYEYKKYFDLHIIFNELVKLFINLDLCKSSSNYLINYNFNESFNGLDVTKNEFNFKFNPIKNRITTPNLYIDKDFNDLFKNCLKDYDLSKEDKQSLLNAFEFSTFVIKPNGYLFYATKEELDISELDFRLIYNLYLDLIKQSLIKLNDIEDFNLEISKLDTLKEGINKQ